MEHNGALTAEDFERDRLRALSAQSMRDEVAVVEIVYHDKWVRFDVTTLQAACLTPQQLVDRCFGEAFKAIGLGTLADDTSGVGSLAS